MTQIKRIYTGFMCDSSEETQDRQRIKRIEQILFHIHPLHLLDPLMAFGPFSAESCALLLLSVLIRLNPFNPCPIVTGGE